MPKNFVTPPFPGYTSGHSTFSRSAAEVLAAVTGTPFFPGGLGNFVASQNEYLAIEHGPGHTVELQWASYYDAADQAGVSRRFGGIHPYYDDYPSRIAGSRIGKKAWARAPQFYGPRAVALCHVLAADRSKPRTIVVDASAVAAHLDQGDHLGPCVGDEAGLTGGAGRFPRQ